MGDIVRLAVLTSVAMAGAFAIRATLEFLVGKVIDAFPKWAFLNKVLPFLAFGAGVGFAYWYSLDFFAWLLGRSPDQVGIFLSGSLVGQGAEVVHKFVFEYLLRDWLDARQSEARKRTRDAGRP